MHELVLVSVHTRELTNMVECVENSIRELECINIAKSVLDLSINDQLCQSENLTHEMERVSESRLLSLFGCKCLERVQVEVVIKMQIRQVLTMNEKIEHIEALSADLKTSFNPIYSRLLEELGGSESLQEVLLVLGLGLFLVE